MEMFWQTDLRVSEKQKLFRKWLKARNNQPTARKAWNNNIVNCYLKKLNLTSDPLKGDVSYMWI